MMYGILSEFGWSAKKLLKYPNFSLLAITILAAGIASSTFIFAIIDGVILKPLDFKEPHKIVYLQGQWSENKKDLISPNDFTDVRDNVKVYESISAATNYSPKFTLTIDGNTMHLTGRAISANFFSTLGAKILVGREFSRSEEGKFHVDDNGNPIMPTEEIMISESLWQRLFKGDPNVIGSTVIVNGYATTLIGVAPSTPEYLPGTEIWVPINFTDNVPGLRRVRTYEVIGRLKESSTITQAQSEIDNVTDELANQFPDSNKGWSIKIVPLATHLVGDVEHGFWLLLQAILFMLILLSINLSSVTFSWFTKRSHEFAIYECVGSTSGGNIKKVITLNLMLSLLGGFIGFVLAWLAIALFGQGLFPDIPRIHKVSMNFSVFGFSVLSTLVIGFLIIILPALRIRKAHFIDSLRVGARATSVNKGLRKALVLLQISACMVLLVAAVTSIKNLKELHNVRIGFDPENLLVSRVSLLSVRHNGMDAFRAYWDQLLHELESFPGVVSAGAASEVPFTGIDNPVPFTAADEAGNRHFINIRSVSHNYFEVMGLNLKQGRALNEFDREGSRKVIAINQRLADKVFGDDPSIGRKLYFDFVSPPYEAEIVGIIGDAKHRDLTSEPPAQAYFPVRQTPLASMVILVKTSMAPESLMNVIPQAAKRVDPYQPIGEVEVMEALINKDLSQPKLMSAVLLLFAIFAIVLLSLGIYGVFSELLTQRCQEFGIRKACGATSTDILRLILGENFRLILSGIVIGIICSYVISQLFNYDFSAAEINEISNYTISSVIVLIVGISSVLFLAIDIAWQGSQETLRYE